MIGSTSELRFKYGVVLLTVQDYSNWIETGYECLKSQWKLDERRTSFSAFFKPVGCSRARPVLSVPVYSASCSRRWRRTS